MYLFVFSVHAPRVKGQEVLTPRLFSPFSARHCSPPRVVENGERQPWLCGAVLTFLGFCNQQEGDLHHQCAKTEEGLPVFTLLKGFKSSVIVLKRAYFVITFSFFAYV